MLRVNNYLNHKWGDYDEFIISSNLIVREIKLYKGGMSSIHRHLPSETLVIREGRLKVWLENNKGDMEKIVLSPGEVINIPSNKYHRIEYLETEKNHFDSYVRLTEIVQGDNEKGNYNIDRLEKSVSCLLKLDNHE